MKRARRTVQRRPSLGAAHDSIGDELRFTVWNRYLSLRAGESANLAHQNGSMLELHVVHSLLRPVVDTACSRELDALPVDAGVVLIERGSAGARTPQIAR